MPRDRHDDEYDDDRPRRRDDRDDDRPRRRDDDDRPRRRRDDDTPPKKDVSVLGIFGLIGSIVAVICSLIPCVGAFGFIPGGIALLKSGIALLLAKLSNGRVGSGIPLTGTIISAVAIVISIIQVVVLGAFAASRPTIPTPSTDIPADVTITAEQLDNEYEDNVIAADAKYKGKTIDVTGVVHRVSDEIKRFRLTVELEGAFDSTVDCDFSTSDKASLSALVPGVTTTIRGTCIGRRTIEHKKWVTLENCTVIPPGTKPGDSTTAPTTKATAPDTRGTGQKPTETKPTGPKPTEAKPTGPKPADTKPTGPKPADNAIKVTATDLAKAFADDEDAADTKYKGKVLEVTGKLFKKNVDDLQETPWASLGDKDLQVECRVDKQEADTLKKVNAGVARTYRGKCIGIEDGAVVLEDCKPVK